MNLAVAQQPGPADARDRRWRVLLNPVQFGLRNAFDILRAPIHQQPDWQPDQARQPGDDKRHLPAVTQHHGRDNQRRDDCADIVAGVEQAVGQRALLLRKPFGDGLDRPRKCTGFADAQCKTREHEMADAARRRCGELRDRPDAECECKTPARAEPIDQSPPQQITHRVRALKQQMHIRVIAVAPVQVGGNGRLENAQRLPIDVVDDHRQKQQYDHQPAI